MPLLNLPPLPYDAWEPTKTTLHLFCQIVGKVRMATHPKLNHWWHVALYPDARGLTTGAIPFESGAFDVSLVLATHRLVARRSDGREIVFPLPGLSVAAFYEQLMEGLADLGVEPAIDPRPYQMDGLPPFAENRAPAPYDPEAVGRFWKALLAVSGVLEEFRGRFSGKSTPVHLFWHSFDLALTRFSGRAAPMEGGTRADREAYSHEVISVGFWPGGKDIREASFYAYAYPEPEGLADERLAPQAARWLDRGGSHLALLPYEAVRAADDPAGDLLAFLEAAYEAGARRAGWPEELTRREP